MLSVPGLHTPTPLTSPQNIEKAKKEIERLEAEESGAATPAKEANGKKADADEAVTEAAEKVAEVSLTEKEGEAPKEVEATA